MFSVSAADLRRLAGVYPRKTKSGVARSLDLGIQRQHDRERSSRIGKYVKHGFPLSELIDSDPTGKTYADLRKPGWLATAIVVNILRKGDKREGRSVAESDLLIVEDDESTSTARISLPRRFRTKGWSPLVPPLEVIDGQHRLFAFEPGLADRSFELPVVAFIGLDISWQAYLFWTINITPKRINPSLAFDLYPLLRTEDWLERFGGERVYRETRAQELVEALWSHPESPWRDRINMLGTTPSGQARSQTVSQAAWIRALVGTFVRRWNNRSGIGGLFGSQLGEDKPVLPWSRAQQAGLLIYIWKSFVGEIAANHDLPWIKRLRGRKRQDPDPAVFGDGALLSTDQGVRGVLYVANDFLYVRDDQLRLRDWRVAPASRATDQGAVRSAIRSFQSTDAAEFWREIVATLIRFDWRTAKAIPERERLERAALRGSGGYKEIRRQLATLLAERKGSVGSAAREVMRRLRFEE